MMAAVMMVPSIRTPPWHAQDRTPAFFTQGTYASVLRPGENVAMITTSRGEPLLWQASADFWMRVPWGYVGPVTGFYRGIPLAGCLYVERCPAPPSPSKLAGWLRGRGVTAVVTSDPATERFGPLLRSVSFEPVYEGEGVWVWRPTGTSS